MAAPIIADSPPLPGMEAVAGQGTRQSEEEFRLLLQAHAIRAGLVRLHFAKGAKGRLVAFGEYRAKTSDHMPLDFLNRTVEGMRTLNGCSCGWKAKKASQRMSTMFNAHMAHLRSVGAPPRDDYSVTRYAEGAAKGYTWNEWYALNASKIDPFSTAQCDHCLKLAVMAEPALDTFGAPSQPHRFCLDHKPRVA